MIKSGYNGTSKSKSWNVLQTVLSHLNSIAFGTQELITLTKTLTANPGCFFFILTIFVERVIFALIRMRYIGNQCKDAYSSPGSSVVESSVVKIKYSAANCIFNPLWSNTVFRIDILRQSVSGWALSYLHCLSNLYQFVIFYAAACKSKGNLTDKRLLVLLFINSMNTDWIGRHEVLLIIKITICEKRRLAKLWKKGKICIKILNILLPTGN